MNKLEYVAEALSEFFEERNIRFKGNILNDAAEEILAAISVHGEATGELQVDTAPYIDPRDLEIERLRKRLATLESKADQKIKHLVGLDPSASIEWEDVPLGEVEVYST